MCEPGAIAWIKTAFGDCVYDAKDKWSFAIGMLSNLMWVVSSAPQIYQNCVTKKVEGQSPFLFSLLETGNILSLIGVIITKGLVTQIITSALYAFLDGIMFTQYLYYRYCKKTMNSEGESESAAKNSDSKDEEEEGYDIDDKEQKSEIVTEGIQVAGLATGVLMATAEAASTNWKAPYSGNQLIGTLFGWIGGTVYIGSRIPQVIKNFQNRKVIDLSPIYVCFTILGNATYCISVFLRSLENDYLWRQTPFLYGAIGPLTCDVLFLVQMCVYGIENGTQRKESDLSDNSEDRKLEEI
ncbi:PQ loop repeat family protein [Tritrichomonas foetus]|uniref:PQ loop repeat family protein n=1 Tax=Tritrichomonas foetus TaxID=1144522 RepID=A0A1J4JKV1_9EUKA|nr:PQ loop repeat family protein [Tritrichomonas foetus]|eukprot:OHS98189.1 PQ loop repeat family protein [Tritrichomonas foetus]